MKVRILKENPHSCPNAPSMCKGFIGVQHSYYCRGREFPRVGLRDPADNTEAGPLALLRVVGECEETARKLPKDRADLRVAAGS